LSITLLLPTLRLTSASKFGAGVPRLIFGINCWRGAARCLRDGHRPSDPAETAADIRAPVAPAADAIGCGFRLIVLPNDGVRHPKRTDPEM